MAIVRLVKQDLAIKRTSFAKASAGEKPLYFIHEFSVDAESRRSLNPELAAKIFILQVCKPRAPML